MLELDHGYEECNPELLVAALLPIRSRSFFDPNFVFSYAPKIGLFP